ncbi:MAG: tryptophan synthase subunit alpha [Candidatus Nanohaloarchaea archaeon]
MSSLEEAFEDGNAFMPFTVAGFPDLETSEEIIRTLVNAGADVIELGVPFSDPMADGPTIKEADVDALENDFEPADAIELASRFRDTPVVLMAYANTLHAYGYEEFLRDAEKAGVNGLIVPDMPPEEFEEELGHIDTSLDSIFLVTQNTPRERVEKIGEKTEGFAYLVSVKGTTGARDSFSDQIADILGSTESLDVPRCIGFGISSGELASTAIREGADGVIVGSALIDAYREGGIEAVEELAEELSSAVRD